MDNKAGCLPFWKRLIVQIDCEAVGKFWLIVEGF